MMTHIARTTYFARDHIPLIFQPIARVSDLSVIGYDVKANRYYHSDDVSCEYIYNIVRSAEADLHITLSLIRRAINIVSAQSWRTAKNLSISIPCLAFASENFVSNVIYICEQYSYDMRFLTVKLSMTDVLSINADEMYGIMRFHIIGCRFSIELVDSGFTALQDFFYIPLSEIRIADITVLQEFNIGDRYLKILCVSAATLGVLSVIEGIDNKINLTRARKVGFDLIQGNEAGSPFIF